MKEKDGVIERYLNGECPICKQNLRNANVPIVIDVYNGQKVFICEKHNRKNEV